MKNKIILAIFILVNSSFGYANAKISSDLESALMCKKFDQINQDLAWVSHVDSVKELRAMKESSQLAEEFFNKFKLKKSTVGEVHFGYTKGYLSTFVTPFKTINFTMDEGIGAGLYTTRLGNIEEIINDFKKNRSNINIYHVTQQQIKDGLKRINSLGSSDNEYIDRFMEELVLTKNGRNYYSNNFYAIRSKNPKLIGAETIIYSDPLNNSLIHTSCTLEFDEY
ncbi:MAG TPA: hypothetical protein PLA93_09440 [Acinetobacter towneri]|uniref:hypothetical protein n=1 Tax=Acinetobacter towneri TaxID=202956 RepID=UPI002935AB7A|nr:hypothetical protein [Acinetobacter towneri]MDV2484723.1 hypothetical protein [Acinetobacter towneri]HRO78924.1 hypothetical protein [Acinetobacter towneri]